MIHNRSRPSGFAMLEMLVVSVIGIAFMGITIAALMGCFSRELLDSYVMDNIVTGLLAIGVVFCVVTYGLQNRSTTK